MNKRFCKLGTYAARAFFLFALCGAGVSCSDDYKWDNEDPEWLGSSIYDYLDTQGNYKNFVKLIDDLDYKEVLQRTGSKTLFVADDDAFSTFYQTNPWGVKNYEGLRLSQKKLLLNSAMINNAYLLEMMSSTPAGSDINDLPEKGQCLRRETAYDITDSVPRFIAEELPISYNADDKDYWARFRDPEKGGIVLALDATTPMMTHFLPAQMQANNITGEDFQIITGQTRNENDAFIYDSKVIGQDITCRNGYVNKLDKVLVPPQNMAEVLRTNSNTKIFSHMMDRFSAPFYNENLTRRYQLLYGNDVDSVYQKRYFSKRSQGNSALSNDAGTDPVNNPRGNNVNYALNFDPGWNTYQASRQSRDADMGVIFAPIDDKLMNYFFSPDGGGRFLIEAFAPDMQDKVTENTTDMELVYKAIDQIPLDRIQALVNNLMKESFVGSVPSKFETIKNDAQDPMLDDTHLKYITGVKMANNGIIYLMDEVITPAQYASVSAPAYVAKDMRIFNWAIQQAQLGGINSNYSAYLLAMSSRFSFFVPKDDFWYIDPLSFYNPSDMTDTEIGIRAFHYTWDEKNNTPKVASHYAYYDFSTGDITINKSEDGIISKETVSNSVFGNRLKDMLETHTIIHEDNTELTGIDETETGVECNQKYFITKNGTALAINNAGKRANGMTVQGGWQVDNNQECNVIRFDDKSRKTNGNGNGFAYELDVPIQPSIESVYSAMYKNPEFSKFFNLCQGADDVLSEIGMKNSEIKKYTIFVNNNGLPCYDIKEDGRIGQVSKATNVRFFNNYRYTIYVPTNKAMEEAEAKGLPTWDDLRRILEMDLEPEDRTEHASEELEARNAKVLAMATSIINFVKNHFVDNSVFADAANYAPTQYETSTITDSETGIYCKVTVQSDGNGQLQVKDATGKTCGVTDNRNIIVRDYITAGKSDAYQNTIVSSSSAVLHGINGVLDYKTYDGGRYDSDWSTVAKAREYVKKYPSVK